MLKIINNLTPFFEDCYRRINVREYAKILKISPPTASKLLLDYYRENLLLKEDYRNYIFFYANKDSKQFIDLSRIYWDYKLKEVILFIRKNLNNPLIILFGSFAKAEVTPSSDIDLAVFSHKKQLTFTNFEKKLNRKIQLFWFNSLNDVKSKELLNNIVNGYVLSGRLNF